MSWQQYVDSSLMGTGKVDAGAIFGVAGGIWAKSANFNLSEAEVAKLAENYKTPSNFFGTGIIVEGTKYMTIKGEERSVYGKSGKDGVCMAKTNQCVVIATYKAPRTAEGAAVAVEKLADYLIQYGY
eukprot:ANDGO_00827.mRNA.1 Profilin